MVASETQTNSRTYFIPKMKNYSLIVSMPDAEPTLFELKGDRVGLGREVDNQICLKMDEVSSSHCEFRKVAGGGYEVVDLDSTNGTRVNGKKIEKHALVDGDRLLIGEVLPAHFVELAEGEKPAEVAVEAGEGGKKAAAAYTQMDEKLQSIEADIAAKSTELEELEKEHVAKQAEYEKMSASLAVMEAKLAEMKAGSDGSNAAEIAAMEKDLMTQTQRVQILRTDLDGQAQQLQALQGGAPAPLTPAAAAAAAQQAPPPAPAPAAPVVPVPMSASPHAQPAAQPAPQQPAQPQPLQPQPLQPHQQPPQPAQPQPVQPAAAALPVQPIPTPPAPQPAQPHAQPAQSAAPVPEQPPVPAPATIPLVTPPSGPKTTLLTPGSDPNAPKTKRLLVEEPTKPKAKLNFGGGNQQS